MDMMPSSVLHVQVSPANALLQPRAKYVFSLLAAAIPLSYPEAKPYDSAPSLVFLFLSFP